MKCFLTMDMIANAIQYHEYGKPQDVLKFEKISIASILPHQVLIKMKAASINPSDFGLIMGKYGSKNTLPSIAGREGVGEIVELGDNVKNLNRGDLVNIPQELGTWLEYCVSDSRKLFALPKNIEADQAALSFINPPTAWLLLHHFIKLKKGDWIIQNAANSQVGICLIQFAKLLGFKTINVVRRKNLETELQILGADVVVTEDEDYYKSINEITQNKPIKLAINSVGGSSVSKLIRSLSKDGMLVTIGAMDFEPIRFPTRELIFNNISLKGFWLDQWLKTNDKNRIDDLLKTIFNFISKNQIIFPIEKKYRLCDYLTAFEHSQKPRFGKIIFTNE